MAFLQQSRHRKRSPLQNIMRFAAATCGRKGYRAATFISSARGLISDFNAIRRHLPGKIKT
jgi:hypothetical protein